MVEGIFPCQVPQGGCLIIIIIIIIQEAAIRMQGFSFLYRDTSTCGQEPGVPDILLN